ncbi:MAG: 30S ribosomal protein S6 [Candidatus Marinimicrobia bacterium]|nr:30S ribosomal protein S6 [Candidatus Neomarinimicrobiota bacterium]
MRYYEMIYIANPNLEDEDLSRLVGVTKDILKKRSGELLYDEVMGKKRLAYPVEKQRYGTYILLQFKGDGLGNVQLNRDLELNEDILAHMIVTIDEEDVRQAKVEEVVEVVADREEPKADDATPVEAASGEAVVEAEVAQDQERVAEEEPTTTVEQAGADAQEAVASSDDEDPQPKTEN